jgi:hypothetical protein
VLYSRVFPLFPFILLIIPIFTLGTGMLIHEQINNINMRVHSYRDKEAEKLIYVALTYILKLANIIDILKKVYIIIALVVY